MVKCIENVLLMKTVSIFTEDQENNNNNIKHRDSDAESWCVVQFQEEYNDKNKERLTMEQNRSKGDKQRMNVDENLY